MTADGSINVCILGISGDNLDEGMKNFGRNLHKHLVRQGINAELVDIQGVFHPGRLTDLRSFDPDIIHLIPGPTLKGLFVIKILGQIFDSRTVVSATHPHLASRNPRLLSLLKPNIMLVQSSRSQKIFEMAGFETGWLPSGVDTDKFYSVSNSQKEELRQELGFPVDERLFLHVGHLKRERNILELDALSDLGTIIIIGSPSTSQQPEVINTLRENGHHVYTEYIENIERYYQMSDYYVFATEGAEHSIELPLSVLEAMSCNISVITKRFGGLPDLFDEGNGLVYFDDTSSLTENDLPDRTQTQTRELVREYSWNKTAETAVEHYQRVL